jgi:hypothetical protein
MFRILHLASSEIVHNGNTETYQNPPVVEFTNKESAEIFLNNNIFVWKHRRNFYGIVSKIRTEPSPHLPLLTHDNIEELLINLGVLVPKYQLEIIEVP